MTAPDYPDVMRLDAVAKAMGIAPRTILNNLSAGTFLPLPFAERPLRWRGEDIAKWYRGEYREAIAKLRRQVKQRAGLKKASGF